MSWFPLHWEGLSWLPALGVTLLIGVIALIMAYRRAPARGWLRATAGVLKLVALVALCGVVLEPLFSGERPRSGANVFITLADNSRSMQLRDRRSELTRGEQLREALKEDQVWRVRLAQDFDVRNYAFDSRLRSSSEFASLSFDGRASALATSLRNIAQRFRGRPVAGVLLLTDGNATDLDPLQDLRGLPPIYPVLVGSDSASKDVRIVRLVVNQSNFETAPVALQADVIQEGLGSQDIVVQLLGEDGEELQKQVLSEMVDGEPAVVRFRFRTDEPGLRFFHVRAFAKSEGPRFDAPEESQEATLANNTRIALVDRGGGPFRILYVGGRPNWEFKFLRRSLEADEELELVGLLRIAKREPKFDFRSRRGESTNPLFRGFDNQEDEQAEQYDEPVLLRLGTKDQEELRDGFPKAADKLFAYHAIVLDDLESEFFTQDQMLLIQKFASHRGGGVLMLGGLESFAGGKYARTPLGEMLPVYMEPGRGKPVEGRFRLSITRDGLHPPWSFFRVRGTLDQEKKRLLEMPDMKTVNRVKGVKPGATVLAEATNKATREKLPALVAQRFGAGRTGALLVGDMWRWAMRRKLSDEHELEKMWRQTLRWLVADVPQRVQSKVKEDTEKGAGGVRIETKVRDEEFKPLDNAAVKLEVTSPDGKSIELTAEAADTAGLYRAEFIPRASGAYRAKAWATAPDGSEIGQSLVGWTSEPDRAEFARLRPNRDAMERIAKATGGEVLTLDRLPSFVNDLPNRKAPITETWVYSWWELPWRKAIAFLVLVLALSAEWGIRRWNGLP